MAQIIPKIIDPVERHWQKELANCLTDPLELVRLLDLPDSDFTADACARKLFPLRVPRPFVARMRKGDPDDPLLRQVLTLRQEFDEVPGFTQDPLDEQDPAAPGLLHKYQSRVLMIVRGGCAVNCRYCFRRHFPYSDNTPNKAGWQPALDYIAARPAIDEVIYSGGDPLMAKDDFLAWLTQRIEAIPHVRRLRIHSRLPVVIPQRVNDDMLHWFTQTRLTPVMVLHINHANEVDEAVSAAVQRLRQTGVTVLNQAVLLKGVSDSVESQVALNRRLFDTGVMPYYLHVLDKVKGAAHFDVSEAEAKTVMAGVIAKLPGYMVPKLVREIGDQPGKTPVDLALMP
ncbi:Lysine 2,3-aminomutase [Saliniradius amylolyticus]|uniref:L-lysine 2,3-aminomutase n=1 Tax=Saliniradius amylolyticus TaxID=2183582 RepID=A0A2S2E6P1_9ALTE|nr:EF-P beta-lysylation protein EpmB [Saliniradius amylolyticus]AWL13311.1 Lysine 2,3-aminomutase [Saliniradius amylolyticus]